MEPWKLSQLEDVLSLVLLPGDIITIIFTKIITMIIAIIITMTTTIVAMFINISTFQFLTFLITTREPVTVAVKMLKEGHTDGEMIDFVKVVL